VMQKQSAEAKRRSVTGESTQARPQQRVSFGTGGRGSVGSGQHVGAATARRQTVTATRRRLMSRKSIEHIPVWRLVHANCTIRTVLLSTGSSLNIE